jgi:MFS family permease
MVTINQSILLISLPALFRGIKLNPLVPSNTSYFLWTFLGFLLVTAVLVVSLGRAGDIYGRVKMYNLGFAVFTFFSIMLSVTWLTGPAGALWIIIMRVFQGVGGAFLFANSTAILTDAFPPDERGKAMGINGVAAVGGSFLGLMLGGLLAPIEWRLVFLVSVPFGLFGTVWAYLKLRDNGVRLPARIDWLGNALFAIGLISVLTGIVYSRLPYGGHPTGWSFSGLPVPAISSRKPLAEVWPVSPGRQLRGGHTGPDQLSPGPVRRWPRRRWPARLPRQDWPARKQVPG